MWKKLSSKEVFIHPRLTILEDEVVLPNGHRTSYVHFKDDGCAVTVIAQRGDGKILLQKEYSYPINKVLFQFPGGHVPEGEDAAQGANRELMEEAKLKAGELSLLGSYLNNNRRSSTYMHVFLATNLVEEALEQDLTEEFEDFWCSEEEVNELIRRGQIINNNLLAAWSIYKVKNNRT